MSTATAKERWTCNGCGVSVGQIDGGRSAIPDSWSEEETGTFCLLCRRDRAANAALDAAPDRKSVV